ncbi:16S rRNA (cytosine(1402)-N(4))-methyltransferase RsmH [Salsipaludibacter albus]|uniref:16S rRNA (cytosine(1402)-N(4))-methyltransferase RsmH n=1 Tax=Salsipaludibacter albus TaxID=2849650 RepID=UPI003083FF5B
MTDAHVPVMRDEVVALLAPAPDGTVVDATLGAGGHAEAVARARIERYGSARLLGIDRDPEALDLARGRLGDLPGLQLQLAQVRFDALGDEVATRGLDDVAGILLDLGVSSMHLDRPERGFSYRQDGPLDMRMGPDAPETAAELLDRLDLDELTDVLRRWGEERHARRVARAILDARPITSTSRLAEVVADAMPPGAAARDRGHPARRTFQALRIAVNGELDALRAVLDQAVDALVPGGVLVVLAYHSLEDRIVKQAFAAAATDCVCPPDLPVCACDTVPTVEPLVRRAGRPSPAELADNPRSSAVRLRAVRRLDTPSPRRAGGLP